MLRSQPRRHHKRDQLLSLVVDHRRLNLSKPVLQEVFDRLNLHPMAADLQLGIDAAEKVNLLQHRVDPAAIAGAVEPAKPRMLEKLLCCLLGKVAVAAGQMHAADAEFSDLSMRAFVEAPLFENQVGHVGKWRADRDRFARPEALPAGVGARFGGAVGVDDLPAAAGPGLHERRRKGLPRGHDEAAEGPGKIDLRPRGERGQQHRRAEQHGDFGRGQQRHEIGARADLLFGDQHHAAAAHPGCIHLRDAAVVAERRGQRGRIEAGHEIEGIGVAHCKVDVTRMRALHPFGSAGGAAGVEE